MKYLCCCFVKLCWWQTLVPVKPLHLFYSNEDKSNYIVLLLLLISSLLIEGHSQRKAHSLIESFNWQHIHIHACRDLVIYTTINRLILCGNPLFYSLLFESTVWLISWGNCQYLWCISLYFHQNSSNDSHPVVTWPMRSSKQSIFQPFLMVLHIRHSTALFGTLTSKDRSTAKWQSTIFYSPWCWWKHFRNFMSKTTS